MLPLKLWIHFPPIAGCTLYHVTIEVVNSLPTHSSTMCTLYHVTIEVVNSLPTHSRVYSVPCYHWSCEFTSHPWSCTHSRVYSVPCEVVNSLSRVYSVPCTCLYHVTIELCTMLPLKLWIHFPPIAGCTLYHVTIEVVNSLPTHSRVYSVPCYHWSCEFTSHP